VGVKLETATRADADWPAVAMSCSGGIVYPATLFPKRRWEYVHWAIQYLEQTGQRTPVFGCFGLHEWAMVYRETAIRHRQIPLRLSPADTDTVTETGPLRCTHYDAFRFFTPSAAPRNRFQLSRSEMIAHDQPGCVHVTMDLYRFAYKIAPFSSARLIADTFELAVEARKLDMRASPYDLREFGYSPIRIETRVGRDEYVARQAELTQRAKPIRDRVLAEYRRLASLIHQSRSTTEI
jgi:hypothetical protein